MKGRIYRSFLSALRALGYQVSTRELVAADYGDPTTRKRLFIMARKGKKVTWPEPTHSKHGGDLFGTCPKWRAAREIINWNVPGTSIYGRSKPLVKNTLKRIAHGLVKFGGAGLLPFIVQMDMGGRLHDIDSPLPTITSADTWTLVEPFVVEYYGTGGAESVDDPLNTVTGRDRFGLVQPFLTEYHGGERGDERVCSVDEPLPTLDTANRFGLVEPVIIQSADGKYYQLDIRYRMLMPSELAAAMSFPSDYVFAGNRETVVKQIGNAVPVSLASHLCQALLS
jgi:DNA (cytosine-5)-methyltransferase 1